MITYRRIKKEDDEQVLNLINNVLSNLENKEFFIAFNEEELGNLYNKKYVLLYGAFDEQKLVGMGAVYISGEHLEKNKDITNLRNKKVVELR